MGNVTEARRWKLVALASMALLIGYVAGQFTPAATAHAGENDAWEYAQIEYVQGSGIQSFRISTLDGTQVFVGAVLIRDELIEEFGLMDVQDVPPMLLVLIMLGEDGWEFAGVSRMQEDGDFAAFQYLLKRRRS
jgi:hypothetical protein